MNSFIEIVFILSFLSFSFSFEKLDSDLKNVDVEVLIDLTSHLTRVTSNIKLYNQGVRAINVFHYSLDPFLSGKLSFIGAKEMDGEQEVAILKVESTVMDKKYNEAAFYRIKLSRPLNSLKTISIVVDTVYSDAQSPLPKEISQDDRQLVQFTGNLYYFSPYHTASEVISVHLSSDKIESYTQIRPVNLNQDIITYGPFKDILEYAEQKFTVHFENHSPFLTTWNLDRWIEVSHWGNIAVEEKLHIQHTGAKLKGSFSRYDFQRNPYGGSPSAIRSFKTLLPASGKDVYYRDGIGNISTSNLLELNEAVELEIRPRFPLFGGWQTRYTIGYNIPSYEHLYQQGNHYGLKMRFMDHIYDNQYVEDMRLSIVLPEGSRDITFSAPFPIDNKTEKLHFTYLDTIGRIHIDVRKRRLVDNHIQDFTIYYTFNSLMLLQEPILVFITVFLLFLFVIISVRLDFSIVKDGHAVLKMHHGEVINELCSLFGKKVILVEKVETAIEKYKANKDRTLIKNVKNYIDNERKQCNYRINQIQRENRFSDEIADWIKDITLKDSKLKENLDQTFNLFEKHGIKSGSSHSQEELDSERKELINQIQALLLTL